ncbi:hypothetical protein HDZ31DRAFT_82679 [Schizophyllum fasciatum]
MATVSHTIYSRYDPADREKLEKETGQATDADESEDWALKSSFLRASSSSSSTASPGGTDVADWYKALASRSSSAGPSSSGAYRVGSSSESISRPRTAPLAAPQAPMKKPDKNDWFIQKVLRNPDEQLHEPAPSASSLADILARDPPPMPDEQPFRPPVFLALGPTNRGWGMLQKSGWREGDTLGPSARKGATSQPSRKGKERVVLSHIESEAVEFALDDDGELKEVRKVDVVDLTLSDSDSDDSDDPADAIIVDDSGHDHSHPDTVKAEDETDDVGVPEADDGRRALVKPIATVLKSDRLGIGLKAKTEGPYKASKKRVTHNAAALAAHIRAAEQVRRQKAEMGRGHRAYDRQDKREQRQRRDLLAYMNA